MARKPRIEFEGALYHVITRGNQRRRVFKRPEDYSKYLDILAHYKRRYKYSLYGYVCMSNHVHLLIQPQAVPLSKILQGINQSYTMYFNRKYRTVGHLFQGRYKAILCDKDEYLLSLIKYLHHNPVRAGIAKNPEEYPWSSERSYLGKNPKDGIDTDEVLKMFSSDKARAKKLYRAFIGDGLTIPKEEIYKTVDQRILGHERFVEKVLERTGKKDVIKKKRRHEYSLEEIAGGIETALGITLKQLRAKGKQEGVMVGRKALSFIAKDFGYKGQEIAQFLQKDPAVITRYLKDGAELRPEIEKTYKTLEKEKRSNINKQV